MHNKTFKQIHSPLPYRRHITTTTTVVAAGGVTFIIPGVFSCLLTVIGYCYFTSALQLCPTGIPNDVYTLQEHKEYLEILEIFRRSWLAHVDFIRGYELIDRATFLSQNPQSADLYNHLSNVYQLLISKVNNGLNFEAIAHDFDVLTLDLQNAILLEDPSYVNPWRVSEFETEEEMNSEAVSACRKYFGPLHNTQLFNN